MDSISGTVVSGVPDLTEVALGDLVNENLHAALRHALGEPSRPVETVTPCPWFSSAI